MSIGFAKSEPVSRTYDEGIALSSENLDGVDSDRLGADTVGFDDSQRMTIDAEGVIGVARDRHQTEAVSTQVAVRCC